MAGCTHAVPQRFSAIHPRLSSDWSCSSFLHAEHQPALGRTLGGKGILHAPMMESRASVKEHLTEAETTQTEEEYKNSL